MTGTEIFNAAFFHGREPRSEPYRIGVLQALLVRVDGLQHKPCPYAAGTAEADAYHAGIAEGRALSPVGGR